MNNKLQIIETPDYILAVSDEEIKEGDLGYEKSLSNDCIHLIYSRNEKLCFFRFRNVPIWLNKDTNNIKKIIAYQIKGSAPELDLPLLPEIIVEDDVEELTKIDLLHLISIVKKSVDYNSVMGITLEATLIRLLKQFDKIATKIYSEEDLKKIREMLVQGAFTDMSCSSAVVEFDKIIQSLKQPKTPKWFVAEMKCGRCYIPLKDDDCWSAKECSRNSKNDLLLTITINGKTYLVGTYLYD
jgi:hypothetical protein